jgi:hypothetical protein
MPISEMSPSQFLAIQDEWSRSAEALEQAEAFASEALSALRARFSDSAKQRMKFALDVRSAAEARMRTLIQSIWNDF